ncbi:MAG: c-type cytochrome [Vicinamibacterales bacterium]
MIRRSHLVLSLALAAPFLMAKSADGQAKKRAAVVAPVRVADPAPARFGIGRAATPEEIRAIDIDVMPDGRGLPPGKGTAAEGKTVYEAKCRSCHGADGQGGPNDRLVGRDSGPNWSFATDPRLVKTVGNYWPYATTLFDYTRRAMPFMTPGTLTADETYSLVAYILALNKIVPEDMVMDQTTLPKVVMPARDKFVKDDRKGGPVVK